MRHRSGEQILSANVRLFALNWPNKPPVKNLVILFLFRIVLSILPNESLKLLFMSVFVSSPASCMDRVRQVGGRRHAWGLVSNPITDTIWAA